MATFSTRVLDPVRILAMVRHRDAVAIVRAGLATLPHDSRIVDSSQDADRLLRTWQPHLVIVEFGLAPPSSGPWFGRDRLRSTRLPVIAIVPSADDGGRLQALRAGADDALSVPFPPEELALRVELVLRHLYGEKLPFRPAIDIHDLSIDLLHKRVTHAGQLVALTGTERTLLFLLAANQGRVMTRAMIVDALWGQDQAPTGQDRRSTHPLATHEASRRLAQSQLHRNDPGPRLPVQARACRSTRSPAGPRSATADRYGIGHRGEPELGRRVTRGLRRSGHSACATRELP